MQHASTSIIIPYNFTMPTHNILHHNDIITKQFTEVLATLQFYYTWMIMLGSPEDLVCQSPISFQYLFIVFT